MGLSYGKRVNPYNGSLSFEVTEVTDVSVPGG
jgi:hypothetical protein